MTYADFLARARAVYGVRLFVLRTDRGDEFNFLVRPLTGAGVSHLRHPEPNLAKDERVPAATIARVCRALRMKPHDFGLFIG